MASAGRFRAAVAAIALVVAGGAGAADCPPAGFGDGLCALGSRRCGTAPRLALLSAFPAELAPLLARTAVEETIVVGDRVLRTGTLGGVRVVLALLGIGLVNAGATARLVLDRFDVDAVLVSGVAGAPVRIGDVTVPDAWLDAGGGTYAADGSLLALARTVAAAPPAFTRCTPVPLEPPGPAVCLAHEPAVVVGGTGRSSDPFGDRAFPCDARGGDVFGCDACLVSAPPATPAPLVEMPAAEDMETAAVAREAAARGIPFVAFRAVSDGAGDPLGLPGFPAQFFTYYRLAAENAAAATAAVVARWGATRDGGRPARGRTAVRPSCAWQRRATPACTDGRVPRGVTTWVQRACRRLARATPDAARARTAWRRAAAAAARPATRRRVGPACQEALGLALGARASAAGDAGP